MTYIKIGRIQINTDSLKNVDKKMFLKMYKDHKGIDAEKAWHKVKKYAKTNDKEGGE